MKISRNILILLIALFAIDTSAQDKLNWKKHLKLADEAYENAQYADAADHYRDAWRQKTKNKELIYKAGECFYILRDYKNAADAFQHVKNQNDKYPLIGLRYARCLKQSGDYEMASRAFVDFMSVYDGEDRTFVAQIVQNEIRGCELAMEWATQTQNPDNAVHLLSSNVNTPETEFAPFPFSDEILYFSSTMARRAEIYRTQKIDGQWTKAVVPESFPKIEDNHFCNGTLTPDHKRFYFTICESVESWGGLTTRCEIFVTKRINTTWSPPQKLREYINMAGVTTTHPFVVHEGDSEILYFSSNREGGKGGMDIWYTTRDVKSNDIDFTFPINLGELVNTPGDEITPYFDDKEGVLYFSSNGQVTTGGYDIFKSKGNKTEWEKAENIGPPYNSPADDFFFVKTPPTRKGGFLVSNRIHGMEKITTTDEDIFEFSLNVQKEIFAKGSIYESETGEVLEGVIVTLFEVMDNGSKKLVTKNIFEDGNYYFDLMPEKSYSIEARKDGFLSKSYNFDTNDFLTYDDFGAPIYLEKEAEEEPIAIAEPEIEKRPINTKPSPEDEMDRPPGETQKPALSSADDTDDQYPAAAINTKVDGKLVPYRTRGKSKRDSYEIVTNSPRRLGTYYKIQLIAVVKYSPNHSRYRPVEGMGRLDTEYIVKKRLTRVLLAEYETLEDAKGDLKTVRQFKNFERAFIVKYIDGERIGRVY